jgi:hypothetical protein
MSCMRGVLPQGVTNTQWKCVEALTLGWSHIGARQPCRPTVTPPLLPLTPPTLISCVSEAGGAGCFMRAWDTDQRTALAPSGGHYLILLNALQPSSHLCLLSFPPIITHQPPLHVRNALPLYAHHYVSASASSHILNPLRNHSSQRSLLVGLSSTLVLDHPESTATPPRFRCHRPR